MTFSLVYILLFAVVNVYGLGKTILDGDVYIQFIGAIYSNSSCNTIEAETVQNIQAIKWTLTKLNDADYIPNLNIGLRISQTCKKRGEPEKLTLQMATEMYNNSGKDVRIIGVIGSDYSFETESISRLLSSLPEENRLLQGAFSATSASLRDRNVYKNFFRTIPPDDIQVEVMIEFMEALNWTYMAIIYDDDSYGRGGKDELLLQSKGLDVCFPVLIAVNTTYNNEIELETDIKDKIIGADVPISGVLVFGSSFLADLVLIVTEKVVKNNKNVVHPVFLFSEAGGYIQGRHENISKGAFVLSPPKRVISSFQEHWTQIFTDTSKLYQEIESNSLIREVYTEIFNCTPADTKEINTCRQLTKPEFVEGFSLRFFKNAFKILVFARYKGLQHNRLRIAVAEYSKGTVS
ncbi:metabotropic glutamate receptor 7-like [Ruditapes philippinarum]|uniref:metabotropic glutamate receptor 7-like n=1 Tax=Ruditapes philippinarum TaxID=129788 RepID=UPI00295BF670|nr:metabotropic glutamate receptor 7-like [Ruditapes philippinarum]